MFDTRCVPSTSNVSRDSRWYAVQSRPKQEQRAAMNLMSSGVTTFLPMIRQSRIGCGPTTMPLFPGYLFVRCEAARWLPSIRYTRGVAKLLGTSDGPTPVDDTIIQTIQSRIGDEGYVELTESLEAGDHVEITAGPLRGLVAIFDSATTAADRVVLLINAVHSQMRVVVESNAVKRLSA